MSSRDSKRRTDSHHSTLSTADLCVALINSMVVAIASAYQVTGSLLVSVVAGCLAVVLVGLALCHHR